MAVEVLDTVPNVQVYEPLIAVFIGIIPPSAQPLLPLPPTPLLAPGRPAPPYGKLMLSQPLNDEVGPTPPAAVSNTLPGRATHTPPTVPVICMSNLEVDVLTNLNVNHCVDPCVVRFGPAGK